MKLIFDSHAHYLDAAFKNDRDELLTSLFDDSVCGIIESGTTVKDSKAGVKLAHRYPNMWATVGVHPTECMKIHIEDIDQIKELAADPKVVAIGEIGYDLKKPLRCDQTTQELWFREQLIVARELSKPVVIHCREAFELTYQMLKEYPVRGVVHCFSGSVEFMRDILNLGLYIGIGGAITFHNNRRLCEAAAEVPADRFLLETDAPYMTPEPFRGTRCDSSLILHTAAKVAELRACPIDAVLEQAAENTRTLFSL